jgi:hypothetical protein
VLWVRRVTVYLIPPPTVWEASVSSSFSSLSFITPTPSVFLPSSLSFYPINVQSQARYLEHKLSQTYTDTHERHTKHNNESACWEIVNELQTSRQRSHECWSCVRVLGLTHARTHTHTHDHTFHTTLTGLGLHIVTGTSDMHTVFPLWCVRVSASVRRGMQDMYLLCTYETGHF